jgi:hypothetical protein
LQQTQNSWEYTSATWEEEEVISVPKHMKKLSPRGRENLWEGSLMKKNPQEEARKRDEEEVVEKSETTIMITHFELVEGEEAMIDKKRRKKEKFQKKKENVIEKKQKIEEAKAKARS